MADGQFTPLQEGGLHENASGKIIVSLVAVQFFSRRVSFYHATLDQISAGRGFDWKTLDNGL